MTSPSQPRLEKNLPAAEYQPFQKLVAERTGPTASAILHGFLIQAARQAMTGRRGWLPKAGAFRSSGTRVRVKWPMTTADFDHVAALLAEVGSSAEDVLILGMRAYREADGDQLVMNFPPQRRALAQAS